MHAAECLDCSDSDNQVTNMMLLSIKHGQLMMLQVSILLQHSLHQPQTQAERNHHHMNAAVVVSTMS